MAFTAINIRPEHRKILLDILDARDHTVPLRLTPLALQRIKWRIESCEINRDRPGALRDDLVTLAAYVIDALEALDARNLRIEIGAE